MICKVTKNCRDSCAGHRYAPKFIARRGLARLRDFGFRIPNFASPPTCRFRTGPAIPHARSGRILGPPAPPDCNRATAVLHEKRAHDNGGRSATSYTRTAESVRRNETACRRPAPLAAARFRAPHSTPGPPHRDSARSDASGIMRTSIVSKYAKPPPAAPDIQSSAIKTSASGRSAGRFPGNDSPPSHRRDRGKIAQGRGKPVQSIYSAPCPGSRKRHFPYTSPRPAFSVFFISEMIVIGPTPPGTGVM